VSPLARLSGFDRSGASSTRLEKLDSNKCRHWTEFWSDKARLRPQPQQQFNPYEPTRRGSTMKPRIALKNTLKSIALGLALML
jgi:hypothetical protein